MSLPNFKFLSNFVYFDFREVPYFLTELPAPARRIETYLEKSYRACRNEMSLRKIKRRLSTTFRLTVDGSLSDLAEQLTLDDTSSRRFLAISDSTGNSLENGVIGKGTQYFHL